ncbi:MAG: IS4 family transposase [Opitutaceae bacterium]
MPQACFFGQLSQWKVKFHKAPELPFSQSLSAERIEAALERLGCKYRDRVYSPAVTLWMFLSQVLSSDPSCRDVVARNLAYRKARGLSSCSTDTASYCQARMRLPEALIPELVRDTGRELTEQAPEPWRWNGRKVKIADGSTASMPDTAENTQAFGKPSNQKGPCGFPIVRILVVLCLATGAARDMAVGPYCGKQSGELSLFRSLSATFETDEIVLADRLFCAYSDIARLHERGVDTVFRLNAQRKADFRRGQRLGKDDHIVVWKKPTKCPKGLSAEELAALPDEMKLREIRVRVGVPGYRVKSLVVVTTLLDQVLYTKADLALLYRQRWHGEVDLRSLKSTLQMDVLRCKTPEMVRKEIWMHLLANNLLRSAMCATAIRHHIMPRQLSFRATQQLLNAFYLMLTSSPVTQLDAICNSLFDAIEQHIVGNRPNRYEPRKRKRAAKPYPPLKLSREVERKLCLKSGSA